MTSPRTGLFLTYWRVEVGQLLALGAILVAMGWWRRHPSFLRHAYTANVIMMAAGFTLVGFHLTGYVIS